MLLLRELCELRECEDFYKKHGLEQLRFQRRDRAGGMIMNIAW